MTILRRNPLFVTLLFVGLMAISSCRTAQQSRRANPAHPASSTPAVTRQMDSLLMIEQKLTEVIDSMASLVDADHARIRSLEEEVRALQHQAPSQAPSNDTRTPVPPNDPTPPTNSYLTAPPPSAPQAAPPSAPQAAPPNTPPSAPPSTNSANTFQQRYTDALSLYNDNNFGEALDQFKSLENDDPNGTYASNYKYWEGECYYGEKRYNKALETFGTVLNQYPNSTKVAATLFKTGECYERLKDTENARASYERVLADYPSSEFHARALARLKALSK